MSRSSTSRTTSRAIACSVSVSSRDPIHSSALRADRSRELGDREAADRDREALRPQPGAVAGGTRLQGHQTFDPLPGLLRVGVRVAPLEADRDPLELGAVVAPPPEAVLVGDLVALVAGALEQDPPVGGRQVLPGQIGVDAAVLADRLDEAPVVHRRRAHPGRQRPLGDRERRIGDAELGIDDPLEAEAVAALAGAVRGVEGEDPRLDLGHRGAAVEAGELLAEDEDLAALAGARPRQRLRPGDLAAALGALDQLDLDQSVGEAGGRLDRLREALAQALLHDQPVDHDRDVVLEALVEDDLLVEAPQLAVDDRAGVALLAHLLEQPAVLALALADDRRQDHEAGLVRERHHPVGDLLDRLTGDRLAAGRAVRLADPRPEQAQVVVDLGHGADGRARVARGRLLVDRDRRAEALDRVDVGLVHLAEELAGIGRQGLDVAALALGVDRVEGEAGLAGAGESGHHDEGVARQLDVDVLQVVFAGTGDNDAAATSVRSHLRKFRGTNGRSIELATSRLNRGKRLSGRRGGSRRRRGSRRSRPR